MKLFATFCVLLLCLFAIPAFAQDATQPLPDTFLGLGLAGGSEVNPSGFGIYERKIAGFTYSYNGLDVIVLGPGPTTWSLPRVQVAPFSGVNLKVLDLTGKTSLWTHGTLGVASDGSTVVAKYNAGGRVLVNIKARNYISIGGDVSKDAQAGRSYLIRAAWLFGR